MTLPFGFGKTLSPSAKCPTLVPSQFIQRDRMLLLQRFVRGSRLVQHPSEFRRFLLGFCGALLRSTDISLGVFNLPLKLDETA